MKHIPCKCYIVKQNGDPLTTVDFDKDSPDAPSRIWLCSLHNAAPKLLEACKAAIRLLNYLENLCFFDDMEGDEFSAKFAAVDILKTAIVEAEDQAGLDSNPPFPSSHNPVGNA